MMKHIFLKLMSLMAFAFLLGNFSQAHAATMYERVEAATRILEDKQGSADPIPKEVFDRAKGVAIVSITKAGLVFGGTGGQGVVIVKKKGTNWWLPPSAFDISGGSFGAQIGVARRDYIAVLNTDRTVRLFTTPGKIAWDAQATGIAGEEHATERVTDLKDRPVIVYQSTDGVYGGATLGGTTISLNDKVNKQAYGRNVYIKDILDGKVKRPKYADRLYELLAGSR